MTKEQIAAALATVGLTISSVVAVAAGIADYYTAPKIIAMKVRRVPAKQRVTGQPGCVAKVKYRSVPSAAAKADGAAPLVWTETVELPCAAVFGAIASKGGVVKDGARPKMWPQDVTLSPRHR